MQIIQTFARSINLNGEATYRFDNALPKPCIHPLITPAGAVLSAFEPSDHVWHRGLWFTIKFINGTNFWEEHAPFGIQKTEMQPRVELLGPDATRLRHSLLWTSEATGPVIRESRTLTFRGSPEGHVRLIDFSTELVAEKDLTLDRTPFTTWGGYGGLSFRATRELHDGSFTFPNGKTGDFIPGESHEWMLMRGLLDGGVNRRVAMGVVDHPDNARTPTPWYCRTKDGATFWNAAFLFHEPMKLVAGASLKLQYRIAYRDGDWPAGEFQCLAKAYREGKSFL